MNWWLFGVIVIVVFSIDAHFLMEYHDSLRRTRQLEEKIKYAQFLLEHYNQQSQINERDIGDMHVKQKVLKQLSQQLRQRIQQFPNESLYNGQIPPL